MVLVVLLLNRQLQQDRPEETFRREANRMFCLSESLPREDSVFLEDDVGGHAHRRRSSDRNKEGMEGLLEELCNGAEASRQPLTGRGSIILQQQFQGQGLQGQGQCQDDQGQQERGHLAAVQQQPGPDRSTLTTQVSFCQDPPTEHNYPPVVAPRRHFSFGALRTYSESGRSPQHINHHHRRVSRQKTLSGDSTVSTGAAAMTGSNPGGINNADDPAASRHVLARALSRTCTLQSTSSVATEEWRPIFEKLLEGASPGPGGPGGGFGFGGGGGGGGALHGSGGTAQGQGESGGGVGDKKIPLHRFREMLEDDPLWSETIPREMQEKILANVDKNGDNAVDYEEFLDLVRGQDSGFGRRQRQAFRQLLKQTVEFIVPYKYSYQNQYSCSPPPLFMPLMSLLQTVVFTYNCAVFYRATGQVGVNGPAPLCSRLIFDPDKRHQIWRYVTYMMVHSGIFHVVFNVLVQLVLGIPLEMVHGWWRVMLVYLFGVLAGSLWTNVLRPTVFLSGASGGVYALITAHLGTVIMNFREMTCPWCRVLVVSVVAVTDLAVYIYDMHIVGGQGQPVSYAAHLSGALTGLLVGITCLKNLRWETYERYIWAVSATVFVLLIGTAIIWNFADPSHFVGVPDNIVIDCISDDVL